MRGVLEFFDIGGPFDLPAEEAINAFRARGLKAAFDWRDYADIEKKMAFSVTKMLDIDLLRDVQDSLTTALEQGASFRQWADDLVPLLQSKGWWGRKEVRDPLTGQVVVAQLGSPHRLKTIFRTNMASAYATGQWVQIEQQAADAPYLLYDAVDDFRTRPEHAAWDGVLLPVSSKFWRTHYPPNGFNCRCTAIQLDEDDIERMGLTARKRAPNIQTERWVNPRTGKSQAVPRGIDAGFAHNPGIERAKEIRRLLREKVAALPPDARDAVNSTLIEPEIDSTKAVQIAEETARDYVLTNGARRKIEFAAAFDELGETILRKSGQQSSVSFTDDEIRRMRAATGVVLYHNHPNGTSLSKADLLFAQSIGLKQIVAVGSDGSETFYSASVLIDSPERLNMLYGRADDFIYTIISNRLAEKKITVQQANELHAHFVNSALAEAGAIAYTATNKRRLLLDAIDVIGRDRFENLLRTFADAYR